MLTLEQVELLLVDVYNSSQQYNEWEEVENWYEIEDVFGCDGEGTFNLHGVTISGAEFDTGGEGHGEDIYMVFKTVDREGDTQYWRKDGYYASWAGDNWDGDFKEVKPVERVVTFYE